MKKKIIERIENVIDVFLNNIKNNKLDYRTINNVTEFINDDYKGRTIIELFQNAYDAVEKNEERNIKIVLDNNHLYFANKGKPFDEEGFTAICSLAQSTKEAGNTIGNKGVGFKSVLNICDEVAVFSANMGTTFKWQFEFNRDRKKKLGDSLKKLQDKIISYGSFEINVNAESFKKANTKKDITNEWKYISHFELPFPVETIDNEIVKKLREEGYETVILLYLNNAPTTHRKVLEQLNELKGNATLFLSKLSNLEIVIDRVRSIIRRTSIKSSYSTKDITIEEHNINDAKYIVATKRTSSETNDKIKKAVKSLPKSWHKMNEAKVQIAFNKNLSEAKNNVYIYFPTEKNLNLPFHINSNFVGSINRKEVDFEWIELNKLLIDEIVKLYCETVDIYVKNNSISKVLYLINLPSQNNLFVKALMNYKQLDLWRVIPVKEEKKYTWGATENTFLYPKDWDFNIFSQHHLEKVCNIKFAYYKTTEQNEIINNYAELTNIKLFPDYENNPSKILEWSELIAEHLKTTKRFKLWDSLYLELSELIEDKKYYVFDKKILLAANDKVYSTNRNNTQLMLPPTTGKYDLPDFLHSKLIYFNKKVKLSQKARRFLTDDPKLVNPYDFKTIFEKAINPELDNLKNSIDDAKCTAILQFMFNYYRTNIFSSSSSPGSKRYFQGILLPTKGNNWCIAQNAYFSKTWTDKRNIFNGEIIESYFNDIKSTHASVHNKLVVSKRTLKRRLLIDDENILRRFLLFCGVNDVILLKSKYFSEIYSSYEELYTNGNEKYITINKHQVRLPQCRYSIYVPYQLNYQCIESSDLLTPSAYSDFCKLVFNSINKWSILEKINFSPSERGRWDSRREIENRYFLPNISFIPCHEKNSTKTIYKKINNCWYIPVDELKRNKRDYEFIEYILPEYAELLDKKHIIFKHGLKNIFNSKDAPMLIRYLLDIFGTISTDQYNSFKRLYRKTWENIDEYRLYNISKVLCIDNNGKLFIGEKGDKDIYFPDDDNTRIWLNKSCSFIFIHGMGKSVQEKIKKTYEFPLLSSVENVLNFSPKNGKPDVFFTPQREWLNLIILANLTFMSGNAISFEGEVFKKYLTKLRDLKIYWCDNIHISLTFQNTHLANKELEAIIDSNTLYILKTAQLSDIVEPLSVYLDNKLLRDKLLLSLTTLQELQLNSEHISEEQIKRALGINKISIEDYFEIENIVNDRFNSKKDRILLYLLASGIEKTSDSYNKILSSDKNDIDFELKQILKDIDNKVIENIIFEANKNNSENDFAKWLKDEFDLDLSKWNEAIEKYGNNKRKIEHDDLSIHFDGIKHKLKVYFLEYVRKSGSVNPEQFSNIIQEYKILSIPQNWKFNYWEIPENKFINELKLIFGEDELFANVNNIETLLGKLPKDYTSIDSIKKYNKEKICILIKNIGLILNTDMSNISEKVFNKNINECQFKKLTDEKIFSITKKEIKEIEQDDNFNDFKERQKIAESELKRRQEEKVKQKELEDKKGRTIKFLDGSVEFDTNENYDELIENIKLNDFDEIKNTKTITDKTTGNGKKIGGGRGAGSRLSQPKKDAIGFVGEYLAYQYFKQNVAGFDDSCWKSENRNKIFYESGDDNLGYDFEYYKNNKGYHIEVKCSYNEINFFDFSANEMAKAREDLNGKFKYQILYIRNIANIPQFIFLPNPYSSEGMEKLLMKETGSRISFKL